MLKLKSIPKIHLFLMLILLFMFIWSAFKPDQLGTWFLEVLPVILGTIIILYTYNSFRLTTLVYVLLCLSFVIALIGGHYGYGKVPLFNWFKDYFHSGRNFYDRFAHLIGGLVAAVTIREIILRKLQLSTKFLIFLVLGLTLGISASYELAEGLVALIMGKAAEAFVGLQGDIWDTHWDMSLNLLGAIFGLLGLSSIHNRYLAMIKRNDGLYKMP